MMSDEWTEFDVTDAHGDVVARVNAGSRKLASRLWRVCQGYVTDMESKTIKQIDKCVNHVIFRGARYGLDLDRSDVDDLVLRIQAGESRRSEKIKGTSTSVKWVEIDGVEVIAIYDHKIRYVRTLLPRRAKVGGIRCTAMRPGG